MTGDRRSGKQQFEALAEKDRLEARRAKAMREQREREAEALAAQRRLDYQRQRTWNQEEHRANLDRLQEQRELARRRRRAFVDSVPEGVKVLVGVLAIALVFACVLMLIPK